MNCIDPPALTALELASYLAGEADAAVTQHVTACPFCRANAVAQAEIERAVAGLLYRSTCPTPEELRDYQAQLLDRTNHSNLALHLAHCPHCTHELFVLQEFMAEAAPAVNPLRELMLYVATVLNQTFPTNGSILAMGQRGTTDLPQLYQAGDFQIGITVIEDPSTGKKALQGVITGGDVENLLVHLWHNNQLVATTTVDPLLGDFQFTDVPSATTNVTSDRFELIVSAPQVKVRIPALQLDA